MEVILPVIVVTIETGRFVEVFVSTPYVCVKPALHLRLPLPFGTQVCGTWQALLHPLLSYDDDALSFRIATRGQNFLFPRRPASQQSRTAVTARQ